MELYGLVPRVVDRGWARPPAGLACAPAGEWSGNGAHMGMVETGVTGARGRWRGVGRMFIGDATRSRYVPSTDRTTVSRASWRSEVIKR